MGKKPVCLITGVAGFIGSHLAEILLNNGCQVVGIDNFYSGKPDNMSSFANHPSFFFHEEDVCRPELITGLRNKYPDLGYCFHLAAIVSVPFSLEKPEETYAVNYKAALDLLEEASRLGFARFVFAGSAAEYGEENRLPVREEYATDESIRLSPYGQAKYLASRAVSESPIGVALRFFNVYGPRQDNSSPYSGVISLFMGRARAGMSLGIHGDGRQTRDFVFVMDVANACMLAAGINTDRPLPAGIYNLGTGNSTTIIGLAEEINRLCANPEPLVFLPPREGDIRDSIADISLITSISGWKPRETLRSGLEKTIRFYGESGY